MEAPRQKPGKLKSPNSQRKRQLNAIISVMAQKRRFDIQPSGCGASTRRRAVSSAVARTALKYRRGAQAANDLGAYIARRPVNCVPLSLDPYGRTVATCSIDGADLGEWLVRNGLALDWLQYSKGRYERVQRDAERAGRGIWKGSYVEPWLYRACIRASGKPPTVRTTQVPILDGTATGSVNPQRAMVDSHGRPGGSSVVWATHANPSISTASLHKRKKMVAANRKLPASGYALEVDGRLKAEFATRDGARAGGEELKAFSHASGQDL
ncbi:thermonuclease family protein [Bradyrhizobium sp. RDI18]|uniref:thermonuclease family protein n=1 Tax=Bradyrhizobium sp. RDI18 TaxID=3367400 RepID=UPI00371A5414